MCIRDRFKGVEATVVIQPGAGRKDVMVCVENWMWVPLMRVMPGEYEVIALNAEDKQDVYKRQPIYWSICKISVIISLY